MAGAALSKCASRGQPAYNVVVKTPSLSITKVNIKIGDLLIYARKHSFVDDVQRRCGRPVPSLAVK